MLPVNFNSSLTDHCNAFTDLDLGVSYMTKAVCDRFLARL